MNEDLLRESLKTTTHNLPAPKIEPLFDPADGIRHQSPMQPQDRAMLRLYIYLRKIRAPLSALDDILKIIQEETQMVSTRQVGPPPVVRLLSKC